MNKNTPLIIMVLLLFGAVVVLGLYYLNLTKTTTVPGLASTKVASPTVPVATTQILATPTPRIETIPFDYEVISVTGSQATLKGDKGEATLPNNPNVKIFKGIPPNETASDFSALAVGQKLRVERTISGKVQEVRVYIVE